MPRPAAMPSPDSFDDPGPSRAVLARRVLGFDEALSNRVVSSVTRVGFGVARTTPELPRVHDLNHVQVERPVAAAELLGVVNEHLSALENHQVWTSQASVAWSIGPALADAGWSVERFVYMVHDRRTPLSVSPLGFDVGGVDGFRDFARARVGEEPWGGDEDIRDQMAGRDQRLADRVDAAFIVSRDAVAGCQVYRHGTIAQIESVGVLAAARGQGLGTGLMAAAMRQAGSADLVFLVADADDWPRRWYARLGFRAVASGWEWNLRQD